MSKSKRNRVPRSRIKQCRILLNALFPKCFTPLGEDKTPLKINIFDELRERVRDVAPGVSARVLRATLHDYTSGVRYLRHMLAGSARVDLDGWPSGRVTEKEAAHAKDSLTRREAWIARTQESKQKEIA